MPKHIVLLRGINIGGHHIVPMERLRAALESMGLRQVRTHIQSGNVVCETAKCDPLKFAAKIEKKILAEFGFPVRALIRSGEELDRILALNPYAEESRRAPSNVFVKFLDEVPSAEAVKKLESLASKTEQCRYLGGREVFFYYVHGMGQSKLRGTLVEKVLGVAVTARNWNTVTKLREMMAETPKLIPAKRKTPPRRRALH